MKKIYMLLLSSLLLLPAFSAYTKTEEANDDPIEDPMEEEEEDDCIAAIPFSRISGGNMMIRASINGLGVDMMFDTGASINTISMLEANYLVGKGLLTEDDVVGLYESSLADGSIVPGVEIKIKELKLDDQIVLYNVPFVVLAEDNASLLLGQAVLSKYSYKVDNDANEIRFYDN